MDRPAFPRDPATLITALPLYHIFALTANCLLFVLLGWRNMLITNPRDFPAFVAELKKYRFTFISGVNTLFNALLHTPGFDDVDFSESAGSRSAAAWPCRQPSPSAGRR